MHEVIGATGGSGKGEPVGAHFPCAICAMSSLLEPVVTVPRG